MPNPHSFAWCRELSSIIGVEPGDSDTESAPRDPARLLPLAVSRPQDALLAARSVLARQPSAYDASLAHHAIGIVLRDRGELPEAIAELKKGMRLARASGRPEREVDVQATLGAALAWTGRSQQGLALLNRAVAASHGDLTGRVLMRRASVLKDLGRFHEAHQDLSRALPYLRRAGDTVWEARSLTHRAEVFLGLRPPRACRRGLRPGRGAVRRQRAGTRVRQGPAQPRAAWRLSAATFPRRSPTSTRHGIATTRSARPTRARRRPLLGAAGRRAGRRGGAGDGDRAQPAASGGRDSVQEGGTALRGRHRRPGGRPPGRRQGAGPPGPSAVPDAGTSPPRRRAPASSSPRPGTPRASILRPCSATPRRSPPVSTRPGPARRCRRTCSPGASR